MAPQGNFLLREGALRGEADRQVREPQATGCVRVLICSCKIVAQPSSWGAKRRYITYFLKNVEVLRSAGVIPVIVFVSDSALQRLFVDRCLSTEKG